MRASMLTSVQSALKRSSSTCTSSSSSHLVRRSYSSSETTPEWKVTVLGASGGIGQPLSLLMKLNPLVSRLTLFDIGFTPGVTLDVSHINTRCEVDGYKGEEHLEQALEGSDLVIVPAGVPRKPVLTDEDRFDTNAAIIKRLSTAIAKYCPNALVNIISYPVNSTVPVAAEVFKQAGTYDEKKLFGVTTLDVVRAQTFFAEKAKVSPSEVIVPVVGGNDGITILPLFSQATPEGSNLSQEEIVALTKQTRYADVEETRYPWGETHTFIRNPNLAMAYAGAVFADSCLKGLNGVSDIVECSYVQSTITDLPFFASKVRLGKNGVEEVLGLGTLSDYEKEGLKSLKSELKSSIEKGIKFVNQN